MKKKKEAESSESQKQAKDGETADEGSSRATAPQPAPTLDGPPSVSSSAAPASVELSAEYRRKVNELSEVVRSRLSSKTESLKTSERLLEMRIEDVRAQRAAIERETMAEVDAILQRLQKVEAEKVGCLMRHLHDVRSESDEIRALQQRVAEPQASADGMRTFLAREQEIRHDCEWFERRPPPPPPDDEICSSREGWPRELRRLRTRSNALDVVQRTVQMKDALIALLLEERSGRRKQSDEETERMKRMCQSTMSELSEWSRLNADFYEELTRATPPSP